MEMSRTAAPAAAVAVNDQAPQRIFFGLWPSAETAAQIMEWAHDAHAVFGGRVMRPETLHLTLAFLGGTPAARVSELIQAAPQWRASVGSIALRRFGRFARPRIVWAGPAEGDEQGADWLDLLYDDLWTRLEDMGWPRPDMVFRPHVSLLRKAGPGDVQVLKRPPIVWTPERCVLVASTPSEGGSHYTELARLPLG
jgi:2'-5' RNA ligase